MSVCCKANLVVFKERLGLTNYSVRRLLAASMLLHSKCPTSSTKEPFIADPEAAKDIQAAAPYTDQGCNPAQMNCSAKGVNKPSWVVLVSQSLALLALRSRRLAILLKVLRRGICCLHDVHFLYTSSVDVVNNVMPEAWQTFWRPIVSWPPHGWPFAAGVRWKCLACRYASPECRICCNGAFQRSSSGSSDSTSVSISPRCHSRFSDTQTN